MKLLRDNLQDTMGVFETWSEFKKIKKYLSQEECNMFITFFSWYFGWRWTVFKLLHPSIMEYIDIDDKFLKRLNTFKKEYYQICAGYMTYFRKDLIAIHILKWYMGNDHIFIKSYLYRNYIYSEAKDTSIPNEEYVATELTIRDIVRSISKPEEAS